MLRIYKDFCARFLDIEEVEDLDEVELEIVREQWISTIRDHERSLQYMACLRLANTNSAQDLQDSLINLVRTQFYARYGDYFAQACTKLKTHAEVKKVVGWRSLSNSYWTDISREIDAEKADYDKVPTEEDPDVMLKLKLYEAIPTQLAIIHACNAIGFNFNDTIALIKHYATCNELMHAN